MYLQGKIYQKILIGLLIFPQKLAFLNILPSKSNVSNFGNNDG